MKSPVTTAGAITAVSRDLPHGSSLTFWTITICAGNFFGQPKRRHGDLRINFLDNRSGRTTPPSSSPPPQPAPKAFVEDNVRRAKAQALSGIFSDERPWPCHYLYDDELITLSMQWGRSVCSANCHVRGRCASDVWRPRFA